MTISDMNLKLDPSQYANQKGMSINHYLVQLVDKILHSVAMPKIEYTATYQK